MASILSEKLPVQGVLGFAICNSALDWSPSDVYSHHRCRLTNMVGEKGLDLCQFDG